MSPHSSSAKMVCTPVLALRTKLALRSIKYQGVASWHGLGKGANAGASRAAVFVSMVVLVVLLGAFLALSFDGVIPSTHSSSTTSSSAIQGVVTGYVTVGPSQPVCSANQSCNVNMSGYSLEFTLQCNPAVYNCPASMATLSPSGHYSILLSPGNYTVTGLYPSCHWLGCSSAFPKTVTVEGGSQVVLNVDIDTGIR